MVFSSSVAAEGSMLQHRSPPFHKSQLRFYQITNWCRFRLADGLVHLVLADWQNWDTFRLVPPQKISDFWCDLLIQGFGLK